MDWNKALELAQEVEYDLSRASVKGLPAKDLKALQARALVNINKLAKLVKEK